MAHYDPTTNVMSPPVALFVGGAGAGDSFGVNSIHVLGTATQLDNSDFIF